MTETTTDKTIMWNTEERYIVNADITCSTGQTTFISAHDFRPYRHGSATIYNAGEGGTVTVRCWVNDAESSGTLGTAANGWAEYGTDVATLTIASGATKNVQWTGRYRWVGVSGTVAAGTSTVSVWAREYS